MAKGGEEINGLFRHMGLGRQAFNMSKMEHTHGEYTFQFGLTHNSDM